MLRSVGAVLAGELTLVISSFALEFVVDSVLLRAWPQSFPNLRALATSNAVMALTVGYTVLCSGLAGFVAALVAGRSEVKHAMALAALQEVLTASAMVTHPGLARNWVWACNLTLVPVAIVLAAQWRAARKRAPITDSLS